MFNNKFHQNPIPIPKTIRPPDKDRFLESAKKHKDRVEQWDKFINYSDSGYFFFGLLKVKSFVTAPSPTVILSMIGLFLNFSCQQTTSYVPGGTPLIS